MSSRNLLLALAASAAALSLSACVEGLPTQVSRFQHMPPPQGQSFWVEPSDPAKRGSIEFTQYAGLVRRDLMQQGYTEASSPAQATLHVMMDYSVDKGRTQVRADPDPFWGPGWGPGWGFGWGPRYSRFGYFGRRHSAFFWGWDDPLWDAPYDVQSYTLYTSRLTLNIRDPEGQSVFEGRAEAHSTNNDLPALVPNLVEAMFTGFPGNSGETVRITVTPPREGHPAPEHHG